MQENKKKKKLILIMIIILIIMFYLLGYRIGKIGYKAEHVTTEPEEGIKLIQVMQDDMEITKNTQLDIFKNEKLDGKKIIAPGTSGKYTFCIENKIEEDVIYNINFSDEMNNHINMKYRLKMDNIYIRGNEEENISIEELNANELIIAKDTINMFTLEWYWEEHENDTYVGINHEEEFYKLNLEIIATKYKK